MDTTLNRKIEDAITEQYDVASQPGKIPYRAEYMVAHELNQKFARARNPKRDTEEYKHLGQVFLTTDQYYDSLGYQTPVNYKHPDQDLRWRFADEQRTYGDLVFYTLLEDKSGRQFYTRGKTSVEVKTQERAAVIPERGQYATVNIEEFVESTWEGYEGKREKGWLHHYQDYTLMAFVVHNEVVFIPITTLREAVKEPSTHKTLSEASDYVKYVLNKYVPMNNPYSYKLPVKRIAEEKHHLNFRWPNYF